MHLQTLRIPRPSGFDGDLMGGFKLKFRQKMHQDLQMKQSENIKLEQNIIGTWNYDDATMA